YAFAAKGVDYPAALDSIRAALGDGIPRGALALQVHQLLALFAEGHSGATLDLREDLPIGYLPFAVGQIAGKRLVAFDTEAGGFVDLDRPVVRKLDGIGVEKWIE